MTKRCAIYTRKSTEEGLDQAFNSLDAQREACEAYIASQKSEGWRLVNTQYDDGGLSGGNMDRPALRALLDEIDHGRIDVIVVYKVDRLTRSLSDFVKLFERFDKAKTSFVSVTQQFNTSNSMGRLTLNVLLSFAQFEREVTAERIRDKIAASRKKGLWTGGNPPLGYDNVDRALVVNQKEARIVKEVYSLYLKTGCVRSIIRIAQEEGWTTKKRANGRGGKLLTRGPIYHILQNPVYAGLLRSGGKLHEGRHKAIVARKDWDAVQEKRAGRTRWSGDVQSETSPLAGKLYIDGERMTPSHASKSGRRYRYYISHANKDISDGRIRLKASDVEAAVASAITSWLENTHRAAADVLVSPASAEALNQAQNTLKSFAAELASAQVKTTTLTQAAIINRVEIDGTSLKIAIDPRRIPSLPGIDALRTDTATVTGTVSLRRRGNELRLILGECDAPSQPDETVIKLLARAHRWKKEWFTCRKELKSILEAEGIAPTSSHRTLRLAFLAPDIIEALLDGMGPVEVNAEKLKTLKALPPPWEKQREMLEI